MLQNPQKFRVYIVTQGYRTPKQTAGTDSIYVPVVGRCIILMYCMYPSMNRATKAATLAVELKGFGRLGVEGNNVVRGTDGGPTARKEV